MTADALEHPSRQRPARQRSRLRLVPVARKPAPCPGTQIEAPCDYRLRLVEFDDGVQVRRFECDACGAVTYR